MDDKGHSREDLKTKTPALRDEIQRLFDEGNDLMVSVINNPNQKLVKYRFY